MIFKITTSIVIGMICIYLPQIMPIVLSLSAFLFQIYRDHINRNLENLTTLIEKANFNIDILDNNQKELVSRISKAQRDIHKYGKASKRQRLGD